jgi:hypothetical protein
LAAPRRRKLILTTISRFQAALCSYSGNVLDALEAKIDFDESFVFVRSFTGGLGPYYDDILHRFWLL